MKYRDFEFQVEKTIPARISLDEGTDVGMNLGFPVIIRQLKNLRFSEFNATINTVTLEIYPES